MGTNIITYGSSLRLQDGYAESDIVDVVATQLLDLGFYPKPADGKMADLAAIEQAATLEELFGAFQLIVIRNADGTLAGCTGYDDRYYTPTALFSALAPFLVEGSWFAFHVDVPGFDAILLIEDGSCVRIPVGDLLLNQRLLNENLRFGVFEPFVVRSLEENLDRAAGPGHVITALVRAFSRTDVRDDVNHQVDLDINARLALLGATAAVLAA